MRFFLPLAGVLIILGTRLLAAGFDRPIPQAQSATAEFWNAMACLALVFSMVAVHWLVSRR